MAVWADAEVFKLIDLWKEVGIQEQLEGLKRNKHVHDKLSAVLSKSGYKNNWRTVQEQIKKQCQEYKDNNGLTGKERNRWKYMF